jgi:hypothetical protein
MGERPRGGLIPGLLEDGAVDGGPDLDPLGAAGNGFVLAKDSDTHQFGFRIPKRVAFAFRSCSNVWIVDGGATRLSAVLHPNCAVTLRLARSLVLPGGVMLLS